MKIKFPWFTVFCAATAWGLHQVPATAPALEFDRAAMARGELWRALTAHFVHFNANHLYWDLLGLLLLGCWAELISRRAWLVAFLVSSAAISISVWALQPHLLTYRGLSGVACVPLGLIIVHLLRTARRERDPAGAGVAMAGSLLFLGKTLYETVSGRAIFVEAGDTFAAVPLAHLAGFLTGATVGAVTPSARSPDRPDAGCNTRGHLRETPPGWRFRWPRGRENACPGR